MDLTHEHQKLVDFFASRTLPSGPQHINQYSVFFDLPGAVNKQLQQIRSDVEATRKSAAIMLREVQDWLDVQSLTE